MRIADRYDLCTITVFIAFVVIGGFITHRWLLFIPFGAAAGNVASYLLRRRAGIPDASLIGRWRRRNR